MEVTGVDDDDEFLEYLRLQDKPEMLTKSELLDYVREHGGPISDRQLTSLVTERVIPKSIRVGSRAGAYPKSVGDLLVWVTSMRQRGVSLEAIKELVPLWRFLRRQVNDRRLDLREFQKLAGETVHSPEAAFAVPSLLQDCFGCPECGHPPDSMDVVRIDGGEESHSTEHPVDLSFVVAQQDEDGDVRVLAWMRGMLPTSDEGPPAKRIVLGVPNDVEVPAHHVVHSAVELDVEPERAERRSFELIGGEPPG